MEVIDGNDFYIEEPFSSLDPSLLLLLKIFFLFLAITLYSIFVYFSCILFSKKNLLDINLMKRVSKNSPAPSVVGFFLYMLEYLVIIPVFVFIWFSFYSITFFLLSKGFDTQQILLISASFVSSIRATSFFKESLSKDLATILPTSFLCLVLIGERTLSFNFLVDKISEIPTFLQSIPFYLIFIFVIEMFFRFFEAFNIFILKRE